MALFEIIATNSSHAESMVSPPGIYAVDLRCFGIKLRNGVTVYWIPQWLERDMANVDEGHLPIVSSNELGPHNRTPATQIGSPRKQAPQEFYSCQNQTQ